MEMQTKNKTIALRLFLTIDISPANSNFRQKTRWNTFYCKGNCSGITAAKDLLQSLDSAALLVPKMPQFLLSDCFPR